MATNKRGARVPFPEPLHEEEEAGMLLTLVEEGLLSGLIAQAEVTELLDEFYADLEVGAL